MDPDPDRDSCLAITLKVELLPFIISLFSLTNGIKLVEFDLKLKKIQFITGFRIRIHFFQSGSRALKTKNWKKITAEKKFFLIKNCNLPIPRPP
jgi:hypothetical protein